MKTRNKILLTLGLLFAALSILLLVSAPYLSPFVREHVQDALSQHFQSRVQFADFHLSMYPWPKVTIVDLSLLHHGRTDVPPLIQIAELSIAANWAGLRASPLRISQVRLKGLQITLPPRRPLPQPSDSASPGNPRSRYSAFIRSIEADDAKITLLRAQPQKPPLVYLLDHLELHDVSFDAPAPFEATLINAIPRGQIHVKGMFGPWDSETPRATPVQASYQFTDADLSTIRGLQGILSSSGSFGGPLDYLDVQGTTDTPDFTLRRVDNPIDLRTEFSATVDGTNGNTILHSVQAHFLHTTLSTKGEVVDRDSAIPGRSIDLQADSNNARAEDLIRLAVKTDQPVVYGPVKLRAHIRIPEEDKDLSDRLQVSSHFDLAQGHFTNAKVQDKIDLLSRKGQGEPKNTQIAHVPTQLVASMDTQRAVIDFSLIHFAVPGAYLDLHGTYNLGEGNLNFFGNLFLDAKLSQTTTGMKSFLLKAVDPFFRSKTGGARIPVKVGGTKDHPTFGLGHEKSAKQASSLRSSPVLAHN